MGRGGGPTRGRHPLGLPGVNRPRYEMGPPGWGPPPPGGWGPAPPGGWGPPPSDWEPRGPPPPGWGPYPDDWLRPPEDWGRHLDDWRSPHLDYWRPSHPGDWRPPHPDDWRAPHHEGWRSPPEDLDRPLPPPSWGPLCWSPEGPPEPWGPEPCPPPPVPPVPPVPTVPPPGMPPPPSVGIPPPDPAAFGPVPPVPPPTCIPPFGFPAYPPPGWAGETVIEEPMPNPPPEQPEWIKALISAPAADSALSETKTTTEEPTFPKPPAADPATAAAQKPKPDPNKTAKTLGLLGKRTFEKPPPGRSMGIISFIGPTFGYIEREDLEKFTFSFNAFFGNPKAMMPGVRVHFTGCKEKNSLIATDVKVAPGGTENVDTEIYEAVVSQPISEPQPGGRQYPGQVHVTIGPLRTNLAFDRKDSTVTLLRNDHVLINLLTDIVTEKRRATNIRPTIPATFSHTQETREKGVIITLKDSNGIIRSEKHGKLPFNMRENFSDVEFTLEDVGEEVEFTILPLKMGNQAIRIRRVKEPLLLTLSTATAGEVENGDGDLCDEPRWKAYAKQETGPNMKLDNELYEGVVSQPIIEPTPTTSGYPGQIYANIGPVRTNVTFDHRDCSVTLLKNDHVLINLLVDVVTRKRRAANIRPKIPFTFSYTKEKRELGIITSLGPEEGVITSDEHGEILFDVCENFSDNEFNSSDVHKEVEFTTAMVKLKKRAIRLRRMKRSEDKILEEQKRSKEEEEEEERKRKEEDCEREAERRKKEVVVAALAAAKDKWTPLGFTMRDPCTLDDISKERFVGTVLRAISKQPRKEEKKEVQVQEERGGGQGQGQTLRTEVKIKVEKMEEEVGKCGGARTELQRLELKEELEEEDMEVKTVAEVRTEAELGRLVMTVDGLQKQLPFGPRDLLTTATMLDGDKVRFNIATHCDTKVERATYVEILPDSFEESTEQRRHGIVIEFSQDSGLIKCSQNPQLFFHMSEVIEKKKLELNEKVEFSVVPHETAEGGNQAIRIKRYTEGIFLPTRKLGGVGATKGKMTIKLSKTVEDSEKQKPGADKLKAVVKNLRAQDSKSGVGRRDYSATHCRYGSSRSRSSSRGRSRSKSKSRSRSPPKDQFGRVMKKRRSSSIDHKSHRGRLHRRSRSHSSNRSRSCSRSRDGSRDRSRDGSKDGSGKRRSKTRRVDSHRRRRELSPLRRHGGVMDIELARKKRELEELNEMIAYKKSLVEVDTRGLDPGQRTCIDYDHGRIALPLAEYKPVRSILKKRAEGPEYPHRPSYDDPYYERPYSLYKDRRYADPYPVPLYAERPYSDRLYSKQPYESQLYAEPSYGGPPPASHHYTDRYDVYDEHYNNPVYTEQPYDDVYRPMKLSKSPEPNGPLLSSELETSLQPSLTPPSSSQPPFKPPSPTDPPPRSPSPKLRSTSTCASPSGEKPPLNRFLDMLNKKVDAEKKSEPIDINDDLLPHERALKDGSGFSRIVGLAPEQHGNSRKTKEKKAISPEVERMSEEAKDVTEPYDKIQSLLRTIGLKLSTGDVSTLKSSSTDQDILASPRDELPTNPMTSVELDHTRSLSPARSSSLEPLGHHQATTKYDDFLDQQELAALKKAAQLQSLTKTLGNIASNPKPPLGPPPAQYQRPPALVSWSLGGSIHTQLEETSSAPNMATAAAPTTQRFGFPPGPPPGPPPCRPFITQTPTAPDVSGPSQPAVMQMPPSSSLVSDDQVAISTTVARCLKVIETVKSLVVQPPVKQVKSVQFSLPSECLSAGSAATSVETDDDIKAKQKEKLDLYNQRLLEKREQQYQEMLARKKLGDWSKDGTLSCPGKPISSEPRNVWICGHSLVYWAESRARSPEVGMQLGMDPSKVTIWWKGTQGMTWSQLLPQLHQLKVTWPNPDVLIVHLGGNDLSTDSPTDLLASVKKDLTSMRSIFPQCFLVWSNILPRRIWRHSADSHEVDLVRTTVNRRIQNIISELGGTSLTHDNIRCGANTGLYRVDGVHLSPKGIDVFNLNLQDFLEKWELEVNKTCEKS